MNSANTISFRVFLAKHPEAAIFFGEQDVLSMSLVPIVDSSRRINSPSNAFYECQDYINNEIIARFPDFPMALLIQDVDAPRVVLSMPLKRVDLFRLFMCASYFEILYFDRLGVISMTIEDILLNEVSIVDPKASEFFAKSVLRWESGELLGRIYEKYPGLNNSSIQDQS